MKKNSIGFWLQTILDFIKIDLLQFIRSPASWITSLLTPITMIASFGLGTTGTANNSVVNLGDNYFQFVAPGIMFVGLMFSSTFHMGFQMLIEKKKRIIEDVLSSSIPYSAFVLARYLSTLIKALLQIVLLTIISVLFFGVVVKNILALVLAIFCTTFFFSSIAMLLAIKSDEVGFSGLSNMLLVPLFYFSGVFFPIENLKYIGGVLKYFPTTMHVELFRYAFTNISSGSIVVTMIVSVVIAVVLTIVSSYTFKKYAI